MTTETSFSEYLGLFLLILLLIVPVLYSVSAQFRFHCRLSFFIFCFLSSAFVGALISVPYGRTPKNHFRMFRIFQCSTFWLGLKLELRNMQYTESDEPYILIANHQSVLDVLTMSYIWPENCVMFLKKSLIFLPGFNFCTYLANSIYVNRFNKNDAHKSLEQVTDTILQKKRKVWIYPEGTRGSGDELLPFKKGAFIVASHAKVPIVPVVVTSYKNFYNLDEFKFDYGGHVIIEALPPIDSTLFEDVNELAEECRKRMVKAYDRINKELGNLPKNISETGVTRSCTNSETIKKSN